MTRKSQDRDASIHISNSLYMKRKGESANINTKKRIKWKMVTTWPPNFPVLGEGCQLFAEWVEDMSEGRLVIDVYGGGELVPPLQIFEAVSSGACRNTASFSVFWRCAIRYGCARV